MRLCFDTSNIPVDEKGQTRFPERMKRDLEQYEKKLRQRKEELETHSKKSKGTREPVELDQTRIGRLSRQDALMQQAMAEATERQRKIEIQRIEAALKRIESGDFGYCATCDEEIAAARLENDPSVPTCIKCAEKTMPNNT